ncbi:MAG TPA: hypothetical protein VF463_19110 [Sphingobium sp.]
MSNTPVLFNTCSATPVEHLLHLIELCETEADMETFKVDFQEHRHLLTYDEQITVAGRSGGRLFTILMQQEGGSDGN